MASVARYLEAVEEALQPALDGMESMPLTDQEQHMLQHIGDPDVPLFEWEQQIERSLRSALFHALEHLHDVGMIFFSASDEDVDRAANQLLERAKKRLAQ